MRNRFSLRAFDITPIAINFDVVAVALPGGVTDKRIRRRPVSARRRGLARPIAPPEGESVRALRSNAVK